MERVLILGGIERLALVGEKKWQAGRNLTDKKSTPTTFTDDRHADERRPHRE
jgi:hypothetical protein